MTRKTIKPARSRPQSRASRSAWRKGIAPALVLFLLAPLVGEVLLGNVRFSEIAFLPFLGLLYGCGAILIRETARRLGRGLPTMLGLGIAYSLIEEAIVDQMLFNPGYFQGQEELFSGTLIPAFGVDVSLTVLVTAMHTIWSTFVPIVIVEGLFWRSYGTKPWLSKVGLGVTTALFVLGSAWLSWQTYLETAFFASFTQLFWAAVLGSCSRGSPYCRYPGS